MSRLDHLWAGWRTSFVESAAAGDGEGCVFCGILASGLPDEETYIVHRDELVVTILNAYPYANGHLLVMPVRHVGDLLDLAPEESAALWETARVAVGAVREAYGPHGINLGANLGRAAGAGVPGHVHLHALPRWNGDTNFMTTTANTRVLPESLKASWERLRRAWPA